VTRNRSLLFMQVKSISIFQLKDDVILVLVSYNLYDKLTNYIEGVDWGVLISFSKLASTVVSFDRKSAVVGTGARWAEVMTALDPYESVLFPSNDHLPNTY